MITDLILAIFLKLPLFVLSLLPIPNTPTILSQIWDNIKDYMSSGVSLVSCFYTSNHWTLLVSTVAVLFGIRWTYSLIVWVMRVIHLNPKTDD